MSFAFSSTPPFPRMRIQDRGLFTRSVVTDTYAVPDASTLWVSPEESTKYLSVSEKNTYVDPSSRKIVHKPYTGESKRPISSSETASSLCTGLYTHLYRHLYTHVYNGIAYLDERFVLQNQELIRESLAEQSGLRGKASNPERHYAKRREKPRG